MEEFMNEALRLAKLAEKHGEVPIGAIVEKNGKIISRGYNQREKSKMHFCTQKLLQSKRLAKSFTLGVLTVAHFMSHLNLAQCVRARF